jgi:hypothetical protein
MCRKEYERYQPVNQQRYTIDIDMIIEENEQLKKIRTNAIKFFFSLLAVFILTIVAIILLNRSNN